MAVHGVLLAAGASRRLGQCKASARLGGETLLGRALAALDTGALASITVVTGAHAEVVARTLAETPRPRTALFVTHCDGWAEGLAASVRAGVRAAARRVGSAPGARLAWLLATCDQPAVRPAHVAALVDAFADGERAMAASLYAGVRGVPAVFAASLTARLEALVGDEGARTILRGGGDDCVDVPLPDGQDDIDAPDDLTRWQGVCG